jgi:uncharacterized protein (TIGR03067 family)
LGEAVSTDHFEVRNMIARVFLAAVACLVLPDDESKDKAIKADLEKIQGTYKMTSLEVDGKAVTEDKLKSSTLTIKGDKYIIQVKDQTFETQMILHPEKKPKTIDMKFLDGVNKDKMALGIYKFDDETFTMCRGLNPGQTRPQDFGTWPDTNTFLVVWKKEKK